MDLWRDFASFIIYQQEQIYKLFHIIKQAGRIIQRLPNFSQKLLFVMSSDNFIEGVFNCEFDA